MGDGKRMTDFASFLTYQVYSDIGFVRKNNEDNYLAIPEDGFFAVMDGMGGGDAGEVASQLICDTLSESMYGTANESPGERKYCLQQALLKANMAIRAYAEAHNFSSMGSTVVSILFNPWNLNQALVCHVGDSRLYCLHQGNLFLVTQDHTVGNEMLQQNRRIDMIPPQLLHALTRVVGGDQQLHPKWTDIAVCPGDVYLLCSDGVWGMLDDITIKMILASSYDPQVIVELLRQHILSAGADDNFTILPIVVGPFDATPFTPDPIEMEESDLLLRVAGEQVDYGR
jgi:serine/threonine protein phosphatase PrpC